ncbi:MAG TPA: chemotaxis-specific protein-glutamate methyltransferase CheB [Opitutaceae bacterium]|jgi:two-component system chemotaxis response regulator CheB
MSESPMVLPPIKLPQRIRAVVVDDSAFVRKVVREMLARNPLIDVVGAARDGLEALQMVEDLRPDVVTCDLAMPGLDGVGFVRRQMARRPVPILILTASPADAERVLEALGAGAVDFVRKPTALATDELLSIREELLEKVKAAARASHQNLLRSESSAPIPRPKSGAGRVDAVVIGISTGGPQALRHLMPLFPADFPVPIALVLHMPVGYTALFASKLNELCKLEVIEAKDNDLMMPGRALLAPAGRHLQLRRMPDNRVAAQLSLHPIEKIHRPSVDVLFQSAADTYHNRILGVVMTGMGDDGKQGAAWIKAQGGTVLTEAEESCVIYGMPRAVAEAGLSDAAIPLPKMAEAIFNQL